MDFAAYNVTAIDNTSRAFTAAPSSHEELAELMKVVHVTSRKNGVGASFAQLENTVYR